MKTAYKIKVYYQTATTEEEKMLMVIADTDWNAKKKAEAKIMKIVHPESIIQIDTINIYSIDYFVE